MDSTKTCRSTIILCLCTSITPELQRYDCTNKDIPTGLTLSQTQDCTVVPTSTTRWSSSPKVGQNQSELWCSYSSPLGGGNAPLSWFASLKKQRHSFLSFSKTKSCALGKFVFLSDYFCYVVFNPDNTFNFSLIFFISFALM